MSIHKTLFESLQLPSQLSEWLDSALHACIELNQLYVTVPNKSIQLELQTLSIVSTANDFPYKPWVLNAESQPAKLYLGRYWSAKESYLSALTARIERARGTASASMVNESCLRLLDQDQAAALNAVLNTSFGLVTGGPGSGKTYFAMQLIRAYLLNNPDASIGICAPTGKAVRRIKEALSIQGIANQTAVETGTVHQLLKADASFNKTLDQLAYDLLIVDEVSMLSGIMAEKLMTAGQTISNMVWLGDINQLPSVEAGEVILDVLSEQPDCIHYLSSQHRYDSDSPIALLAKACLSNENVEPNSPLKACIEESGRQGWESLLSAMDKRMVEWKALSEQRLWHLMLQQLSDWVILNPQRQGPQGVKALNAHLSKRYHSLGIRPVIMRRNAPNLQMFNGDMGILSLEQGVVYYLDDSQLWASQSAHSLWFDDAWMLTVHQAQGSEFQEVWLWIDKTINVNLLTKQLLYTAITRARQSIRLFAPKEMLETVLGHPEK